MAFLVRLWRSLGNRSRFVGRDLEGNKFYENPSSSEDPRRTKRTVQYNDPEDVWKYIGGGKRLSIQWSAWLTHTRHFPPTLEELQADLARQQRLQANVKLIEARERAERAEVQRLNAEARLIPEFTMPPTQTPEQPQTSQTTPAPDGTPSKTPKDIQHPSLRSQIASTLPKMPSASDEYKPESWTPRARRRGS